ncbi:MAG: hypothetical protein KA072_02005 [Thermoanaerobaculaceae bacterium]|nr:hypothetical protein [Thermoanaerobaculaceae bacterium]MDI9621599.1 hypothetical protein [Acidobacteriota bacterium]
MNCYICSSTVEVQTHDDPDGHGTINLCRDCAGELLDERVADLGCEEPDDALADACITAADYMRADGDC